jgi:hypothetical protein
VERNHTGISQLSEGSLGSSHLRKLIVALQSVPFSEANPRISSQATDSDLVVVASDWRFIVLWPLLLVNLTFREKERERLEHLNGCYLDFSTE